MSHSAASGPSNTPQTDISRGTVDENVSHTNTCTKRPEGGYGIDMVGNFTLTHHTNIAMESIRSMRLVDYLHGGGFPVWIHNHVHSSSPHAQNEGYVYGVGVGAEIVRELESHVSL